jgi:N-formylglutamate deformylase
VRYPVYLDEGQLDKAIIPAWQIPQFNKAKARFEQVFRQVAKALSES